MQETESTRQRNFIKGAAILAATSVFVKIIGAIYKIPIFRILDDAGAGFYQATYSVYTLVLTVATFGIPLALSRLVSTALAQGKVRLVKRYFSVSLPAFMCIGIAAMLVLFFFADSFAEFIRSTPSAFGIRVLSPAVFFVCVIAVYRGYMQGFQDMIPTSVTQIVEVVCKAAFGLVLALWLAGRNYESHYVSAGALTGITIGLGLCIPILMWYRNKFGQLISQAEDVSALPGRLKIFADVMKVSIPITIGASFMSIMSFLDTIIVMGRLQDALGYTEFQASAQYGIFARGLTIYNLPSALIVPVSISVMPAIAASIAKSKGAEAKSIMRSAIKLVVLIALPAAAGIMALANPIMSVLYQDSRQLTATLLTILGAASFFVCYQLITTAILQANGHERLGMFSFLLGATVKVGLSFLLVGNANFGIVGSAIGTLSCFTVISLLNTLFIYLRVKNHPNLAEIILKPLLCTGVMAAAALGSYKLLYMLCSHILGTGSLTTLICLAIAIIIGVIVYGALIVLTRTVTALDMNLMPKGEKIAKFFKIK